MWHIIKIGKAPISLTLKVYFPNGQKCEMIVEFAIAQLRSTLEMI